MTRTMWNRLVVGACLSICNVALAAQAPDTPPFSVSSRFNVGGEGRWDLLALDTERHHLFVSRSSHVQVIDTESGKLAGDIDGTDGVHGIALDDDLGSGFTSNGKTNTVTVFDLATLKVTDSIAVPGENPDAILYDPKSRHVFVFNGRSANVSVIDAATRKVIATISLPGKPELAVSDDAGKVFVNIEDKHAIAVIDSATAQLLQTFPLGSGTEPTGLAIDRAQHRLFAVCANHVMDIVDSDSGKVVAEVPIGAGPDSAAFDPLLRVAFSSNGEGTLTLVKETDADHYTVEQNVVTQKGARTMAYDTVNHRAFLVTAAFGETPAATKEQPRPRPAILPDSFVVLVVSRKP